LPKIHSTNPLERVNGEIKRRTNIVGFFPNEAAITRLVGAILFEQNDDWAVQRARSGNHRSVARRCCLPRPPDTTGLARQRSARSARPHLAQWLSDNGSIFAARKTVEIALAAHEASRPASPCTPAGTA
jgi:mutator family transposase